MSSFWSQVAGNASAITPSDTIEFQGPVVVYVGVTGNMVVKTAAGDDATFLNVQAGSVLPVRVKQVKATSTTATNLIALS